MARMTLDQSGYVDDGVWVVTAEPGDVVIYPGSRVTVEILVTAEGLNCDCNKGVLCPLNPQKVI